MTDNEKLIEEAAKAIKGAHGGVGWHSTSESERGALRHEARLALAVFEKAHTPTDDERKVPGFASREKRAAAAWEFFSRRDEGMSHDFRGGYHQGVIDEARRTEVPEPSAEEKIEWPDHWTTNEKLRDLHARWHDQKGNLFGREACGWEHCEFWDAAQFTLRLADVRIAGREPQGEPSDVPALPDDCDCEDREALVRPEGLVCGTCDKLIARAVIEQGENR